MRNLKVDKPASLHRLYSWGLWEVNIVPARQLITEEV